MLLEGQVLKGKYRIGAVVGRGGFSTVYLAHDMQLPRKVWAVKEVSRQGRDVAGRPAEACLAAELELLARLDHPVIVGIHDFCADEQFLYIVMDYVDGRQLASVVAEEGFQSEQDVCNWMLQACDALAYLHGQTPPVIYRDMKPGNLMLRSDGHIKLIDFGVSREYSGIQRTDTVSFGTVGYAAPEQYGVAQTDARSDIYALGATMWHLLAGQPPPAGVIPDVRTRNPQVGEGFAAVIIPRCTALDPAARYQSCQELARDLGRYRELTVKGSAAPQAKAKAKVLSVLAACMLGCLIAGTGCALAASALASNTYETEMALAASAQGQEALDHCLNAIGCEPKRLEAWEALVQMLVESGAEGPDCITAEERQVLLGAYQSNVSAVRGWGELGFVMGKALWSYTPASEPGELVSREAAACALPFLKTAAADRCLGGDDALRARAYCGVARFITEVDAAVIQGEDDQALYAECWQDLESLAVLAQEEPNEVARLGIYAAVVDALENRCPGFAWAGVESSRIAQLWEQARQGLEGLGNLPVQYQEHRRLLTERLEGSAALQVEAAYGLRLQEGPGP